MADIVSRPYRPNSDMCCPGCIWPREPHSPWCPKAFCACAEYRTIHASADEIRCGLCGGMVGEGDAG
jgi:hypothetical protein